VAKRVAAKVDTVIDLDNELSDALAACAHDVSDIGRNSQELQRVEASVSRSRYRRGF
jgi:hypothetical protein